MPCSLPICGASSATVTVMAPRADCHVMHNCCGAVARSRTRPYRRRCAPYLSPGSVTRREQKRLVIRRYDAQRPGAGDDFGPVDHPCWWRAGATGPGGCEAICQEVVVSQVRVHNFSVSLDGFGTGAGQSLDAPFGHAGTRLHEWFFPTRTFRAMQGEPGGSTGIDDAFASAWAPGIGAEIMGRGKFGPDRRPSPDREWNGWWGDTPPFRTPVFVLTHHPRPAVRMNGGTTFDF